MKVSQCTRVFVCVRVGVGGERPVRQGRRFTGIKQPDSVDHGATQSLLNLQQVRS